MLPSFFVVYKFYGLGSTARPNELETRGKVHCATSWEALTLIRGAEFHLDYYCFRAPYVARLLEKGLRVPEGHLRVGDGREGWTLGAALTEGTRADLGAEAKALAPLHNSIRAGLLVSLSFCTAAWLLMAICVAGRMAKVMAPMTKYLSRKSSFDPFDHDLPEIVPFGSLDRRAPLPNGVVPTNPAAALSRASSAVLPAQIGNGLMQRASSAKLPQLAAVNASYGGNVAGYSNRKRYATDDRDDVLNSLNFQTFMH